MTTNPRLDFQAIAKTALTLGILSQIEIDLLCMKGTRKSEYWSRHLRNLKEYTAEKIRKLSIRTKEIDDLLAMC